MCEERYRMPLIGEKIPEFEAETTQGTIHFPRDYEGKWVIFFSHPADFTPVCTTEFVTFASMADEFKELHCELLGLSIVDLTKRTGKAQIALWESEIVASLRSKQVA